MANKRVGEEPKIFDVAKPGKGKIVTTSRPIVAPVVSQPASEAAGAEAAEKIPAPSTTRKVIQPINITSEGEVERPEVKTAPELEKAIDASVAEATEEPKSEAPIEETPSVPEETPEPVEVETPPEPAPEPEKPVEEAPPQEPAPKPEPEAPAPSPEEPTSNDAANVDALAQEVGDKKEAAKKAEDQARRDAEVQALIDSKKYIVPIGHESVGSKSSRGFLVIMLLLVVLFAGAYLAADAELFDVGIELPFDLIKK